MFSFSGNLLAGQHDTQKERVPPARPIPVTFPSLQPSERSSASPPPSWGEEATGVAAHLRRIKKPTDVTTDTLALLNVTFQAASDLENFFSSLSNDAQSHLPPQSWLTTASPEAGADGSSSHPQLLSNGRRAPEQRDFVVRARELAFANADAFATLSRKRTGDKVPLRLAHFRKFWEGLDNMAYYWDNSLDEYSFAPPLAGRSDNLPQTVGLDMTVHGHFAVEESKTGRSINTQPTSPSLSEPRKKAKVEVNGHTEFASRNEAPQALNGPLPARTAPHKVPRTHNTKLDSGSLDLSAGSYHGYRIGNGAEMPDQYRIDCVRAFLEPIAWAFGLVLSPHRRPPVLSVDRVRFPVRMSTVVWRGPQDRIKARQGWLEGPVLGVQCRADLNFGASGDVERESVLDATRELGGLLLLAQERAREGKNEERAGEGKWWTTKARWGGGPGGELGEARGATEQESTQVDQNRPVERNRDGSKSRRKPSPAEIWKILKPNNPLWDSKVTYEAIGKDSMLEWDNVFMVSSLNHHISFLRLHVHAAYLEYITQGKLPESPPDDSRWFSPTLQRTRWYDLFDVEDRKEAMRASWGVMSYQMRANADHSSSVSPPNARTS